MHQKTIVEEYMESVQKIMLALISISCLMAGLIYGALKIMGFYEGIEWSSILLYIVLCMVYTVVAVRISRTKAELKIRIKYTKIYMLCILVIQTNVLYVFFPGKTMWEYSRISLYLWDCWLILGFK